MKENRLCRICNDYDSTVYENGPLVKYSTRHYAHPSCLRERKEEEWVLKHVHPWMLRRVFTTYSSEFNAFSSKGHRRVKRLANGSES